MDDHQIPIDGVLDLHTFRPNEIGDLIPEYIRACQERGIHEIRIIHGKGTGALREGVHRLLEKHPQVATFQHPCHARLGGWGATMARLNPGQDSDE